jgi:hypothetical protein
VQEYEPGGTYYLDIFPEQIGEKQIKVIGDDGYYPWTSNNHGVIYGIELLIPGPDNYRKSLVGNPNLTYFFIRCIQNPDQITVSGRSSVFFSATL